MLASLGCKAQVARHRYEFFERKRNEVARAYMAPFKEKIDELGRLVYNPTFKVHIQQDLSVGARTLHGITVSWDLLSGGVQEHLVVMHRLMRLNHFETTGVPISPVTRRARPTPPGAFP